MYFDLVDDRVYPWLGCHKFLQLERVHQKMTQDDELHRWKVS